MTRIDGSAQLAELLRRRLDALKTGRTGTASQRDTKAPAASSPAADRQDVAGALLKRIQLIAPDDPERERKAFRAFLEATLLAELGDTLINDPGFYQMVEHVQQQMEGDEELAQAIREAAVLLLDGARR